MIYVYIYIHIYYGCIYLCMYVCMYMYDNMNNLLALNPERIGLSVYGVSPILKPLSLKRGVYPSPYPLPVTS